MQFFFKNFGLLSVRQEPVLFAMLEPGLDVK
jgi:hypothetical protein